MITSQRIDALFQRFGLTFVSRGLCNTNSQHGPFISVDGELEKLRRITIFRGFYTRDLVNAHPDKIFVFGDNGQRVGTGGQAIIRGLPNTHGIATKRTPGKYMVSGHPMDMAQIAVDLHQLDILIEEGKHVVIPIRTDGCIALGDGLAQLPTRAPDLYAMLTAWLARTLRDHYYEIKEDEL